MFCILFSLLLVLLLPAPILSSYTPPRFLIVFPTSVPKSHDYWVNTHLTWRAKLNVDRTLSDPPLENFNLIKKLWPHEFLGFDMHGNVVLLQRLGMINFKDLKRESNNEEVLKHFIFIFEYCWNILDYLTIRPITSPMSVGPSRPHGTGVMTSIIDMKDLSMFDALARDNVVFLKTFVSTLSKHYPNRSHRTLLVNSPGWLNKVFMLVTPLLRASTRSKISTIGSLKKDANRAKLVAVVGDDVSLDLLLSPPPEPDSQPIPKSAVELQLDAYISRFADSNTSTGSNLKPQD